MNKSLLVSILLTLALLTGCAAPAAPPAAPAATSAPAQPAKAPEPTKAPAAAAPAAAKPVVIGMTRITEMMDPMFSSSLNASSQFTTIFDVLIEMDQETKLIPSLATKWEVSKNGLEWTFTLREGVKFHDGSPFTADDVKYTFDRMRDPKIGATGNTQWLNNNMQVDRVEVVDPKTVKIITKVPVPAMPWFAHEQPIMSKKFYENMSVQDASKTAMGTGAFKFVEFVKDDHLTVEAFNDWWGGKPAIPRIIYRAIPDASTRVAELTTGGIDVAQAVPIAKLEEVKKLPNVQVKSVVGGCRNYIGLKLADPLYTDRNIRQALNYAVDWETINKVLYGGMAPRMVVNVNPPNLNEKLKAYPYDFEKAKSMLAAAGWKDTNNDGILDKDGKPFETRVLTSALPNSPTYEVITSVVGMYKKLGVKLNIEQLESSVFIDKLIKRNFDGMFWFGSCSTFEGQGDISDLQKSSISNYGDWVNADFEALWSQLVQEYDFGKRKEILDKMQEIVYNEAPVVFLFRGVDIWGVNNRLDWNPHPAGRIWLQRAKLK